MLSSIALSKGTASGTSSGTAETVPSSSSMIVLPSAAILNHLCQDLDPPQSDRFGDLFEVDYTTCEAQSDGHESVRYRLPEHPTVPNQLTLCRPSILLSLREGANYKTPLDHLIRDYRRFQPSEWFYEQVVLKEQFFCTDEKTGEKRQMHCIFGRTRNSLSLAIELAKQVSTKEGGQFKLVANIISIIAFQYWLCVRKFILEYTGCHEGYPKWIFVFPPSAFMYSANDYSLETEPWKDEYTEAKEHTYNAFVYRLLLFFKCEAKMAADWCKYNLGKQPLFFFSVRNFTELQLRDIKEWVGEDAPILRVSDKYRFPRNPRYSRNRVMSVQPCPALKRLWMFYTHRVLDPTKPIIDVEPWASRLQELGLKTDNELVRGLVFQLGAFLPRSDFDILRKSFDISPKFFKQYLKLDAPSDRYCWFLQDRAVMVLFQAVPQPWGERRSHWSPAFLNATTLHRLLTHNPDTTVLRFGRLQKNHTAEITKHQHHYRRIVHLPNDAPDVSRFALSNITCPSIRKSTRNIHCAWFPAFCPARKLTQWEHEQLRQFVTCMQQHATPPNLYTCHEALWLIGNHERSILLTLLDIWRQFYLPTWKLEDILKCQLTKTHLEMFLKQWEKDMEQERQRRREAYQTLEQLLGGETGFNKMDQAIHAHFGTKTWNGYDCVDAVMKVLHQDVLTPECVANLFNQRRVRFKKHQASAPEDQDDVEATEWKPVAGSGHEGDLIDFLRACWQGLPVSVRLEQLREMGTNQGSTSFSQGKRKKINKPPKPVGTRKIKRGTASAEVNTQRLFQSASLLPIDENTTLEQWMAEFQEAHLTLTFDVRHIQVKVDVADVAQEEQKESTIVIDAGILSLEDFAIDFTQWIYESLIRPIVEYVAMECPRPGPRFKDKSYWKSNPAHMSMRNEYVRQLDGVVKKQLDDSDFQESILNKTVAMDYAPEKRLGILFLLKMQLKNLPDENNPKRQPMLLALDEALREYLAPVHQALDASISMAPLPLNSWSSVNGVNGVPGGPRSNAGHESKRVRANELNQDASMIARVRHLHQVGDKTRKRSLDNPTSISTSNKRQRVNPSVK